MSELRSELSQSGVREHVHRVSVTHLHEGGILPTCHAMYHVHTHVHTRDATHTPQGRAPRGVLTTHPVWIGATYTQPFF
jgi:hypothetical protein